MNRNLAFLEDSSSVKKTINISYQPELLEQAIKINGSQKDFMARKLERIALITSKAIRRARVENDTLYMEADLPRRKDNNEIKKTIITS